MNKTAIILIAVSLISLNINCRDLPASNSEVTHPIMKPNNNQELNELIKKGNVVVDFHGEKWCGPCKQFAPVFEKVAASTPNVIFVKVDVDKFWPQDIRSVPTVAFYIDGKKVLTKVGYQTEAQFRAAIASAFGN